MFKFSRSTLIASILASAIALVGSGCGKPADGDATQAKVDIAGELDESSYKQAAAKVLADNRRASADAALTEDRLDAEVGRVEALIALADKLDVDKVRLDDAELTSTLGMLYVRKAAFHVDSAQQAGIYSAKGFRYLDRAVAKYPDNITARLNRGFTSAKVPEFMNKSAVARDDLSFVAQRPEFAALPPDLQAKVGSTLQEIEQRLAKSAARP